nr:FACT complex subunit SSRP1-like [Ipomoea batatas]
MICNRQSSSPILPISFCHDRFSNNSTADMLSFSGWLPTNSAPLYSTWNTLVFRDRIMAMADVTDGEEVVVTFDGIAILTPRGRYNIELHLSFLRLQGQANDFKIQYSSVVRIFFTAQVRIGVCGRHWLAMNEDLLNAKYKDKLEPTYKGLIHDVFTKILRGLSGAKITGPGKFRSHTQGFAVKSSLKAEDGLLYPLEKGFFFLPKPPTLILYDEIDYVEFERHAAGVIVSSSSGFEESSHSYCPLLQEIKCEPTVMCERRDKRASFRFSQTKVGDAAKGGKKKK